MLFTLGVLLIVLNGCSQLGPGRIEVGRGHYNAVVQQTDNEQMLLNLVRLRYRDTPFFLQVASVSTNFEFQVSADTSASLNTGPDVYGLGVAGKMIESPTVTYTPLQGDLFVKELLSPVSLSTVVLLYHSGWAIDRIFNVTMQYLNGIPNAPSASGPTPDGVPEYAVFHRITDLLRVLQKRGDVTLWQAEGGVPAQSMILRIAPRALDLPEGSQLVELLRLPPGKTDYTITTTVDSSNGEEMSVVMRSLMASLFYVSQGVQPLPEDETRGRVTVTRDASGQPFDWRRVTGELMQIHSSVNQPEFAAVRVQYRGTWFYIDDSDLTSKSTFALLMNLFALQAGDVPATAPVLTLPVAR
ncbi:MAG: hypothetical protein CMH81_02365 [Nitrospiraceae bacterium]|nr:hypothetical protein [Nitrospiraceae bacterium]